MPSKNYAANHLCEFLTERALISDLPFHRSRAEAGQGAIRALHGLHPGGRLTKGHPAVNVPQAPEAEAHRRGASGQQPLKRSEPLSARPAVTSRQAPAAHGLALQCGRPEGGEDGRAAAGRGPAAAAAAASPGSCRGAVPAPSAVRQGLAAATSGRVMGLWRWPPPPPPPPERRRARGSRRRRRPPGAGRCGTAA